MSTLKNGGHLPRLNRFAQDGVETTLTLLGNNTRLLSASLPAIANWPRRHPPKVLTDSQIEHFLHAFDLTDPVGLRDHAIARCLLDLGLRGDEATHLTLDAVDWRNGIVTLHRTKSQRVQHLPLPVQTGEALARYLRDGRPPTDSRALFIRHRAPFGVPLGVAAIRNAMNRAFARCALADRFCNTHVLQRSMATRLQKTGVSIKEIADLLRHPISVHAWVRGTTCCCSSCTTAVPGLMRPPA